MQRWIVVIALGLLMIGAAPQQELAEAESGFTCAEFPTRAYAQEVMDSAPTTVDDLDPDGNGIACDNADSSSLAPAIKAPYTVDDAIYLGQVETISDMATTAYQSMTKLASNADASDWMDDGWRRDMLEQAGVLQALYIEAQSLTPPSRFSAMNAEFVSGMADADRAGRYMRLGIDTDDISTFLLSGDAIQDSNRHIQNATALAQDIISDAQ